MIDKGILKANIKKKMFSKTANIEEKKASYLF